MAKSAERPMGVLHYVWANNGHVASLVASLSGHYVRALKSKPHFGRVIFMVAIGPLLPIWYRLRGFQIIHIHWVSGQFRAPRPKGAAAEYIFYLWFRLFLVISKGAGTKIVWTAHNFLPHERVFPDDFLARKALVNSAAAVIALNEPVFEAINNAFDPKFIQLIPAAEPKLNPGRSRQLIREELQMAESELLFSALGHVRPYKGADIFLSALDGLISQNHFLIAGSANDSDYLATIQSGLVSARESGLNVNDDFRYLSDQNLAEYVLASDYLVCPFRQISNSGIINLVMEFGVPLILPNLDSLKWVPRPAAIWYEAESGSEGLREAILVAERQSASDRAQMSEVGPRFMQDKGWENYVSQHVKLYQSVLGRIS